MSKWKEALIASGMPEAEAEKAVIMKGSKLAVSDMCARCHVKMVGVTLQTEKRKGYYCTKCRTVVPLPIE